MVEMETIPCLFCDTQLISDLNYQSVLRHFLLQHRFVVAEVEHVVNFKKYVQYWRERFRNNDLQEFCSIIRTNSHTSDLGDQVEYYLLSDDLPEDKTLRNSLHQERLKLVLRHSEQERANMDVLFSCMFCDHGPTAYFGKRNDIFEHLASVHSFNLGHPDNIVYTEEFLQMIRNQLSENICLWCEKLFKDRWTLKEHMRKKNHKRIKIENPKYNKFYLVNYLEYGKTWRDILGSFDPSIENEFKHDHDLSEWCDETIEDFKPINSANSKTTFVDNFKSCLFCSKRLPCILQHMKMDHGFDWIVIKALHRADFYAQVKLVTFVRQRVSEDRCIFGCLSDKEKLNDVFGTAEKLLLHYSEIHSPLSADDQPRFDDLPRELWDQPSHYFIQVDEDLTLCDEEYDTENLVVSEDIELNPQESVLFDSSVRNDLLKNAYFCRTYDEANDEVESNDEICDLVEVMQKNLLQ